MKSFPLKAVLLSTLLAVSLIILSVPDVYAQTSISGDELCGSTVETKCTPADLKAMGTRLLTMFALLGSGLLVTIIGIRLVYSVFAYMRGDALAIKRAGEAAFNAAIGFFIVFAVAGGVFLILLKTLGTQPWVGQLLQMFSSAFVETAYAQEKLLPNPLGSNSAYDLILAALNLAMRFFIYPGLIVMWVASGFKFIYSQGNPEGLKTARNWLLISFIVTLVAFSLQGFLLAFRATAEKIVPINQTQTQTPGNQELNRANTSCTGKPDGAACTISGRAGTCGVTDDGSTRGCFTNSSTPDGRGQPAPGTYGASCELNGFYGTVGTDGRCQVGGSR